MNENSRAEIPHIELSSDKAKLMLNWQPSHGFAEGLERTVSWYRQYFEDQLDPAGYLEEEALPVENTLPD